MPDNLRQQLREVLADLIEHKGVSLFYVGGPGVLDSLAWTLLQELSQKYPHIEYLSVLAYLPGKKDGQDPTDYSRTIYPEGLELGPPRFAIYRRNNWMIAQSDFVVTYITHPWGGAAQFAQKAERKGKTIIKLGTM